MLAKVQTALRILSSRRLAAHGLNRHRLWPHLPACRAGLSTIALAKTKDASLRKGMSFHRFKLGLVHGILNENVTVTMVMHPLCGNKRLLAVVRLVREIVFMEVFLMCGVAVELRFAW